MVKYKLKEKLKEMNMTQTELRKKLNISSKTMAKFSKQEAVSLDTIDAICMELV